MATGNVTKARVDAFVPEVWRKEVIIATRKKLLAAKLFDRFDSLVKDGGDNIHLPKLAQLAARDKTAATAITYETNTETEATIAIDQHKYAAVLIEDIAKVQSAVELRSKYTSEMGYALAKAIDTSLLGLHASAANNVAAGAALDDADILTAKGYLDAADVDRDGRFLLIHSEGENDLLTINKFTAYDQTGKTGVAVDDGRIASVYGMPVYVTNNIVETGGNLLHNIMGHKEAIGLALQQAPKLESVYDVDNFGWKLAMHTIYGFGVVRSDFFVDIELDS